MSISYKAFTWKPLLVCFLVFMYCCCSKNGYGQQFYVPQTFNFNTHERSERLTGDQIYAHTFSDTMIVWCNDWDSLTRGSSTWNDRNKIKSNNSFLKFAVDKNNLLTKYMSPVNYYYWLTYTLYGYYDPNDTLYHFDKREDTLVLSYSNAADNSLYQEMSARKYSNYYKIVLVLNDILEDVSGSLASATLVDSTSRNFYVDASILTQHYDKTYYGIGAAAPVISCSGSSNPDYINLTWSLGSGLLTPINYELEWTYVDDYSVSLTSYTTSAKSISTLKYDFLHNSTRVWLNDNSYRIPRCHSSGYLVYRVRAVRPDSVLFKYAVYGQWSSSTADTGVIGSLTACQDYCSTNTPYVSDSLNWQYSASFAESGKYKHVTSFYDGLLKNRQSITRCADTNKLIVTNNIYDYEGRLSIKTLPAPAWSGTFSYKHDVSLSGVTTQPYNASDFDSLQAPCPLTNPPPPFYQNSLANLYYSPFNYDTADRFNHYIPNAVGYPFVQTVFQPGFADRVAMQGGAGNKLQIGDMNRHYSENSYVSPASKALNSLFGTNIGWGSYYTQIISRDPNQQLSMLVRDYRGRQMASSMIGVGPSSVDHAIESVSVPTAVFYKQDLLNPNSPNQVIDTIAGTRTTDVDFYNQVQAADSLLYSVSFLPFEACPGQYLSVKGHYNYVVTDQCGSTTIQKSGILGSNGIVSVTPITYVGDTGFLALAAPYHVHKNLSFYSHDVDEALDSLYLNPTGCFRTELSFIKESIDSTIFPCPSTEKQDSTPCDKMKWQMMQQLFPGASYGQFSTESGFVVGNGNSVFSINCPVDTLYITHHDTAIQYCYYNPPNLTKNTVLSAFDLTSSVHYWYLDVVLGWLPGPDPSWTQTFNYGDFAIDKDTCFYNLDTVNLTMTIGFMSHGKPDTFIGTCHWPGSDGDYRGQIVLTVSDTMGLENGIITNGTDSIGFVSSTYTTTRSGWYYFNITIPTKLFDTSLTSSFVGILPSGKTIHIDDWFSGIPIYATIDYHHTFKTIDTIKSGYNSGICSYFSGAQYRYQDTCTVPSLPDTITVSGFTYTNLRTMSADSFIMIYNGAIAEGNYSIAEALLPLHPQYCELQNCFDDTFKTQLSVIPDWHIAESMGLLFLDSLIARDPLIPLMIARGIASPSPADSLRTFPGGVIALDSLILMNAYCSCNDAAMFANCVGSRYQYEIAHHLLVSEQVKSYYFSQLINTYISNRQKYVDEILMQGGTFCSHCASARMTLDPAAVVPPAPYPLGFTGVTTDSAFSGMAHSDWITGVLRDSATTSYDSSLLARMYDSTRAIYHYSDSCLAFGAIDTIMAKLTNCIAGNSSLATNIRDTLISFYNSGTASSGNFTQEQIRFALASNGVAFSDLCNQYLIDCFQFGSHDHTYDCLPASYYSGMSLFLNSSPFRDAIWYGSIFSYTLDTTGNLFERSLGRRLGNNTNVNLSGSYDGALSVYILNVVAASISTDTVKIFFHSGSFMTWSVGMGAACINSSSSAPGDGIINQYGFIDTVNTFGVNHIIYGWIDSLPTMSYSSSAISACVPCTQMRELYTRFNDTMQTYNMYGTDHPYYDEMLSNFMNAQLGQLYSGVDYERFIQSCALADSMLMPLYSGYATYTFTSIANVDSFVSMLDRIDPHYSFANSYRDSTFAGGGPLITVCIDLNQVPVPELWKYKDSLINYAGTYHTRFVDTPLSALQSPQEIGFIYLPVGYAFSPSDSNIVDTAAVSFTGYQKAVWVGGQFVTQAFYDVVAKPGTPPYTVSKDVYLLTSYMNRIPGAVFTPLYMSTINADYFKAQKTAYLNYTYQFQQLPPYEVLDSIQAQYLMTRIPSYAYAGYSGGYSQSLGYGSPTNLYLSDAGMSNPYYDTLQTIIDLAGSSGHIFHSGNSVSISLPYPGQLDAYITDDDNYWYRYFTTGDTLFNVYVSFPEYIPKYMRPSYAVVGPVIPLPADSLNRSFLLNLVRTGTADTVQAYGRTSFVIGRSIELDNVLLGNPLTGSTSGIADTFENCERQLLNSAVNQGIVNYNNYIDSAKKNIKASFNSYVANSVQEQLHLGYWNQEFNYTLYNYDRVGNLVLTVPPAGVTPIPNTGSTLDVIDTNRANNIPSGASYTKLNTYYYNTVNQVKEQTTIDGGTTHFFYDAGGRLIFSQNAKQLTADKFTYNIYDQQSRIIETGEAIFGGPTAPYNIKYVNLVACDSIVKYIQGRDRYDVVMTIYDTAAKSLDSIRGLDAQQNLRKRVSCVKYFEKLNYLLDTLFLNYTYATHYSYDIAGNVQTLVQDFPELEQDFSLSFAREPLYQRYKRIDYDYDQISGKVNMLSYNRGMPDQFYQQYMYDDLNRISKVQTSSNGYLWNPEVEYKYYQHGPLAREIVGYPYVQGIDFAYTIQGWLKAVNNDTISTTLDMGMDGSDIVTGKDAVAYSIDYFNGDYASVSTKPVQNTSAITRSLYNGNISRQTEAISNFQRLNKQYVYDQLNRIRKADYFSVDPTSGMLTGIPDFRNHYDYDADGNLTSLVRFGNNGPTGVQPMDSLIYNYTPSGADNKLLKLFDYSPNNYSGDITNYTTPANRYQYDAIGNTTEDLVSGQDTIEWNLYNKVTRTVNNTDGSEMQFVYDGAGNRVAKKYIKILGGGFSPDIAQRRDYYVRDAQGNVLAVYHDIDTTFIPGGSARVFRSRNFYLSEQDIYGSSRLGIKKFYPGQLGLFYKYGSPPGYTDTTLWNHVPWYSLEYQDVIKADSLNLYGNRHTDSLYMVNIAGQKEYELTDHLGDVLATVSDKRIADSVTGSLVTGGNVHVATTKPSFLSAYDYYPFGQIMPGRSMIDSNTQCITILKPVVATNIFSVTQPWPGAPPWTASMIGSATLTSLGGYGTTLNTTNPGDGFDYTISAVDPGVAQVFSISVTYYGSPVLYTIRLKDGTSGMLLGSHMLSGPSVSSTVTISVTPASTAMVLEITEGGFGGGGGGGIHKLDIFAIGFDSVLFSPSIITSTICSEDGYEYGFNGQMKVNEIAGLGNWYTAENWEYGTREARRKNKDDKANNPSVSTYSVFDNSPLRKNDPLGDDPSNFEDKDGTVVKHVDDGSNAVFKQTGSGVDKHYDFKGFDESQGGQNKVNLTTAVQEAQNLNMGNSSLEPGGGATYCNYATQNVLKTVASATNNSSGLNINGTANSMTGSFEGSTILQKTTADDASQNAAKGGLSLYGYTNTNPPPHNHGHVGTFSVGDNAVKGATANIGANNGFLPLGPGKGSVFTQQKTLDKVEFFKLSPTVTPKSQPQIIPFYDFSK